MTNYAKFETKWAMLSSEFGERVAREWFGDELVDSLPKYVHGKYKGKPKGIYEWVKCIEGGWVNEPSIGGYVCDLKGKIVSRKLKDFVSTGDGIFPGKVICHLGYNENIKQKKEQEEKQIKEAAEKIKEEIIKIRKEYIQFNEAKEQFVENKIIYDHIIRVLKDYWKRYRNLQNSLYNY